MTDDQADELIVDWFGTEEERVCWDLALNQLNPARSKMNTSLRGKGEEGSITSLKIMLTKKAGRILVYLAVSAVASSCFSEEVS